MVEIDDDDRDRGILTAADRKFLRGEREITEDAAVNTRMRIRNRIKHSLADFELLVHNLTPRDRRLMFESNGNSTRKEFLAEGVVAKDSDHGTGMLEHLMIFAYMVCRDGGLDFERLVERSVKRAETSAWLNGQFDQRDDVYDTDVTVELHRGSEINVEHVLERFEDDEYLSLPEIGALVREGLVEGEDLDQLQK